MKHYTEKKFKRLHWTEHSKSKMRQYHLSKSKLINLLYNPQRKELGIVPGTIALMQTIKDYSVLKKKALFHQGFRRRQGFGGQVGRARKTPGEVWLMYQDIKNKNLRKIISAWRYPGVSKPGEEIPIPKDIRQEILNEFQ